MLFTQILAPVLNQLKGPKIHRIHIWCHVVYVHLCAATSVYVSLGEWKEVDGFR